MRKRHWIESALFDLISFFIVSFVIATYLTTGGWLLAFFAVWSICLMAGIFVIKIQIRITDAILTFLRITESKLNLEDSKEKLLFTLLEKVVAQEPKPKGKRSIRKSTSKKKK